MQLTERFATVICLLIFGILVGRHTNTLVNFSYTLLSSSLIAWLDNTAMSKDCIPKRNKIPPTLLHYPWKKNAFILGVKDGYMGVVCFVSVQSLSCVWLFVIPWTPAFSVHHLPELAQTHVHWVSDAIQPSHLLSSPSPPTFNLSQHQGLFKWVTSSHQVAKVLEFQLQCQSFQWIFRINFL